MRWSDCDWIERFLLCIMAIMAVLGLGSIAMVVLAAFEVVTVHG